MRKLTTLQEPIFLTHIHSRDEHGPDSERDRILTFFGPIRAGLGFSAGPDRNRIVISRVCQLKYVMSRVRTPLSFKSKSRLN